MATDPEICHTRINKRRRSGESEIPFSYLQALHDRHESFLITEKNTNPLLQNIPVLYIDGSIEFEHDHEKVGDMCHTINQFVTQTYKLQPSLQLEAQLLTHSL